MHGCSFRCTYNRFLSLLQLCKLHLPLQPKNQNRPNTQSTNAFQLRQECPNVVDPRIAINMDQSPLKHSTMCVTKTFSKERDCSPLIKLRSWMMDAGTLSTNLLLVVQDWE